MEGKKEIVSGSATIMVMMVMTILIIIGTTALHTAAMCYDLAMQRTQIQIQTRSAHSLMQYGVACCKIIDDLKRKDREYTYTLNKWPHPTSVYNGKIIIIPQKLHYEIKTQLFKETQQVAQTSCLLYKGQSGWKIADFVG